jgi:hypothetical protein
LLIVDLNFGAGSVFLVDLDEKVLLKRGGRIVEKVISDSLSFESMVIFFICVKL